MLYKFKSKASGDVIMLEPNGRQVLQAIGKDAGAKGIILPADMPAAISALEAAIAAEEKDGKEADAVSLRQRAVPFLDLLRRSAEEDAEVTWGA